MLNRSRSSFLRENVEENDDEMERSVRRLETEKRMSETVPQNLQYITDAKLKMSNYMQLYSENKICASNAWVLNAIECLKTILEDTDTQNLLNIGADALEVGTKVYTVRVDDTYNQALRLSHELASKVSDMNLDNEGGNENGADDQTDQTTGSKPKRSRLTPTSSFIVKNEREIEGEIATKDSLFSRLQAELNNTGEKYFMGSLPIDPRNGRQQLMSVQFDDDEDNASDKTKETIGENDEIDFELPTDYENVVCAPLTNYSLGMVNGSFTELYNELSSETFTVDNVGNPKVDVSFLQRQSILNRNDSDDDDNDNDNDNNDDDNDNGDNGAKDRTVVNNRRFITSLEPNSICAGNDYMHAGTEFKVNASLQNMWTGPKHWKLKLMGRRPTGGAAVAGASGTAKSVAAARAARRRAERSKCKEKLIDFNEIPQSFDQYQAADVNATTKRYRYFDQTNQTRKFIVPVEHGYTFDRLYTLIGDPLTCVVLPKNRIALKKGTVPARVIDCDGIVNGSRDDDDDDNDDNNGDFNRDDLVSRPIDRSHYLDDDLENASYNYDNPNDSQFSPLVNESTNSMGMVAAPYRIPEVKIDYDKKPSNVDFAELKTAMRKLIGEDNEPIVDFVELYKKLSGALKSKVKGKIDLAVAFNALLHVANDTQTLQLSEKPDGGITIKKTA